MVWVTLLAAMTAVGGLLLLLDNPAPRIDGRTMPALAATGMTYNLESIFRTSKQVEPGLPDPCGRLFGRHKGAKEQGEGAQGDQPAVLEEQVADLPVHRVEPVRRPTRAVAAGGTVGMFGVRVMPPLL